ncbi:sensor histidine kinase [Streptococcus iniae]|uniref:sensor histidine kinase n=1 Tax=Streptococcus iniae TaxID=1346 RepID=UPI0008DAAF55|nr:HAMP domain-containing sensor histidine kinase [Streptococcus iniae]OHX26203.1 two-component sensor histidine kinase [Streptococcus iniae]RLV28536.1 sensor histidine kinase [Streptococcus iniae]
MTSKKLSSHLLWLNSLTLLIGFGLIYFSFNYFVRDYINQVTKDSMQSNFTILDSMYDNKPIPEAKNKNTDSVFVWSHYAIYNHHKQVLFANDDKKTIGKTLYSYLDEHDLWDKSSRRSGVFITLEDKTYYVMTKAYEGEYQDGAIVKVKPDKEKVYQVINFSDVTNTQTLINNINRVVIVILLSTFIVTLLIMRRTFSGIAKSIKTVQHYIESLWRSQEGMVKQDKIIFSEFTPLLEESQAMADRIHHAEESQAQFFQNASHELRTPLMSIQGYTEALQEGVIAEELALPIIHQESQKMKQLVDDIMLISRLDAKVASKQEEVSLKEVLHSSYEHFWGIAKQKNLALHLKQEEQDQLVLGDDALLMRLVSNIISNSLRYAHSYICLERQGKTIVITNDGPPISQEDLPHIFDRFYKGTGGQTGIGLAMVQEIMKQHHGHVSVCSNQEKTQFKLIF